MTIKRIPTKPRRMPDISAPVWTFILIASAMALGYWAGV